MMNESVLSIEHLSVSYGGEDVLHDISFSMQRGEILCLVGESGSGKSTILRAIHGLERAEVTAGQIIFEGSVIGAPLQHRPAGLFMRRSSQGGPDRQFMRGSAQSGFDRLSMRRSSQGSAARPFMGGGIGLIPQNPEGSFNPIRTFGAQFKEMFRAHDIPYDRALVEETLARTGLRDTETILRSRPYEMSGGMNQRIAIAAATLLSPGLLLCDEVTSALDVTTAALVVEGLMKLRREKGSSILAVTHHLGVARRMADRIGIMRSGQLIEFGTVEEIFEHPREEYTRRLLEDVPKLKR